jgi:hypothetical protein
MSTSVEYLRKRLAAIGRYDLLEACERGEVSTFACAEEAGLIKRREVTGRGSENQAKKRDWALMRITRRTSPPTPKPEQQTTPPPARIDAHPMFSQETRTIIKRLVSLDRADLVILIIERKISPEAAGRIAERGAPARETRRGTTKTVTENVTKTVTETSPGTVEPETARKPEKTKPAAVRPDVRALIG